MVKTDNDGDSVYRSFCDKDKLFKMLEQYVKQARLEAIVWMYADACVMADEGTDIRKVEVPTILDRAITELSNE